MRRPAIFLVVLAWLSSAKLHAEDDLTRVLDGKPPADARLGKPRDIYNTYFPMTPPVSREAWEIRRKELREQVLVATGLWPMPEKIPLRPVIHGKIDRDAYTVEKVYFASLPGHYVCGNLYRPKNKPGKLPGVLCPHGHWNNGRFYEASEGQVKSDLKTGAETTTAGAHYPLQARCAQLARMGCVVFFYDMVGYADSQSIAHRAGFTDAEAELRLQSFMGLQSFNSVRALDFLLSLPEVDGQRIGVTGASGGGTQTFILGAVDDRPTVAFPAVMVSTAMQGGCICENCSYLRVGTGNIDIAGLFAPKALGMSGADDWTIAIESKGLPELKSLYRLYGAEDMVMARCFPQFGHNYNQVSRELMYNWFNKHLKLGQPSPVTEHAFVPVPPRELSVFDARHPVPADAVDAARLRQHQTEVSNRQMAALTPKNARSLAEFRRVAGTALRVMIHDRLPRGEVVTAENIGTTILQTNTTTTITSVADNKVNSSTAMTTTTARFQKMLISPAGSGEKLPAVLVTPPRHNGAIVVWVHPEGKTSLINDGSLVPAARKILEADAAVLAIDALCTGETGEIKKPAVDVGFAGFTFGYNRPLLANRVHDILTAVAFAKQQNAKAIHLVGFEQAGPWVVLARALCGDIVGNTAADLHQFRFEQVATTSHEMMLPGALKYGGLGAFAALCAPGKLLLHNAPMTPDTALVGAYRASQAAENLQRQTAKWTAAKVVDWLLQ